MKDQRAVLAIILSCSIALVSCGKKKEETLKKGKGERKDAVEETSVQIEGSVKEAIENAGFKIVAFKKFPSEEQGIKGRILLYKGQGRDGSGGMVYFKKIGDETSPSWHWFFHDMAPDDVSQVELNEDGLWDIRVTGADGRVRDFIQDESFSLMARPRRDWIALNCESSPPTDANYAVWKCFDGDSTTAWRTSLEDGAYIKIAVPFGLQDGILTIVTTSREQPKDCDLYAGKKKIESFTLQPKSGRQMVHLSPAVQGTELIRLVFRSAYGNERFISIADIALR